MTPKKVAEIKGPFMLVQDESADWYVIPASKEDAWYRALSSKAVCERGIYPKYARYVQDPNHVIFPAYDVRGFR